MNTVLLKLLLVGGLLAVVASSDARPVGRSPYAPPAKPEPLYEPPTRGHVPDAGTAVALLGVAVLSLAGARSYWRRS